MWPIRTVPLGVMCVALIVSPAHTSAQTNRRPDFSGTWVAVPGNPNEVSSRQGETISISQTPQTLVISGPRWAEKMTYTFDEYRETVPLTKDRAAVTAKAHWKGETLVAESTRMLKAKDSTATVTSFFLDTFRLDSAGRLVFERVQKSGRGEEKITVLYQRQH